MKKLEKLALVIISLVDLLDGWTLACSSASTCSTSTWHTAFTSEAWWHTTWSSAS